MHVLISISESIRQSIDNNEFGCGIFIDLKKAFDTVNHAILLTKFNHYGIGGNQHFFKISFINFQNKAKQIIIYKLKITTLQSTNYTIRNYKLRNINYKIHLL